MELELFEDADPKGALVLLAFHSTGAAAPIAAAYLKQQLALPLVGHMRVDELGPIVHVSDGLATSPIRILGGEVECSLGKDCDRLFIIVAELPVPVMLASQIAAVVLDWAKDAAFVLCLDAVVREDDDPTADVYSIASTPAALERLRVAKADVLEGGIIVGITAAMLTGAKAAGVEVGALVVEAARSHPDGRAAAQLVQALDPLLPTIKIDPGPLLEEASELEAQIQKSLRDAEQAVPRPTHTFI